MEKGDALQDLGQHTKVQSAVAEKVTEGATVRALSVLPSLISTPSQATAIVRAEPCTSDTTAKMMTSADGITV